MCNAEPIWIAERLLLPRSIKSVLWDMDGVLIDSIRLDFDICTELVRRFAKSEIDVPRQLIKDGFALSSEDFWVFILRRIGVSLRDDDFVNLLSEFEEARKTAIYQLNPGIEEILSDALARGMSMAVVSNNKRHDVTKILKNAGIANYFSVIVGNDHDNLRKKPAPDAYLEAARLMNIPTESCAVIEDSIIGIQAANNAGAYSIGVSTGGDTLDQLAKTGARICFASFNPWKLHLATGNVLQKAISTPNEFVSHMIEHIAWRLGSSIDLSWNNDDWHSLGFELGRKIAGLSEVRDTAAVVGMIDDGSAEVRLELAPQSSVALESVGDVSIKHLLSVRCEQLDTGCSLKRLLGGLVLGLPAKLLVRVCSFEDAHHTWEGVFRAIGIALHRALALDNPQRYAVAAPLPDLPQSSSQEANAQGAGILRVSRLSPTACRVERETAESVVRLEVELSDDPGVDIAIDVSSTIDVSAFPTMLELFAQAAGLKIALHFSATRLSSSHVVLEDSALVLGTALFKIVETRMSWYGINGAGSSIKSLQDFDQAGVAAAISIEGRKFLKMIPFDLSFSEFKRRFIIGCDAFGTLRCEDIDDFLDALAGGMKASILVHFRQSALYDPAGIWQEAISALGSAIKEALAINPLRRGLPPGVKATLV